ncbi:MAG: class I SAM-dependent DNA methyltransferase [Brachyspira sp.]|nr:class I SAM-dependent DNA methyltransferase [Brachyspira sp.]
METALNKLLSQMGVVSAVVSNKWMRAGYGERTREFLYNNCYVFEIIDLGANWFESATVDTNIITYAKDKEKQEKIEAYKISKCENIELNKNEKDNFIFTSKDYGAWIILNKTEKDILEKVKKFKPLKDWNIQINSGIKTGFNEAFIIDEETKNKLILEDKKSKEIIKPLLRGRDIKRYSYDFKNLYLINTHNGIKEKNILPIDINKYSAIKKHLDKYYSDLEVRQDKGITPYNLRNCAYLEDFEKSKIIFNKASRVNAFYLDDKGKYYGDVTIYILSAEKLHYLLAILNSKMFYFAYNKFYAGGGIEGELTIFTLENFPIPEVDKKTEKEIINLVEKVIEGKEKGIDTRELEGEIDKIVYELYNLNENEIKIIEGKD